jgi:hypothetical protein
MRTLSVPVLPMKILEIASFSCRMARRAVRMKPRRKAARVQDFILLKA